MKDQRHTERAIQLSLTHRYARMALAAFRQLKKKYQKQHDRSTFVPALGRFDANLMRVKAMDDMIDQLASKLDAANKEKQR